FAGIDIFALPSRSDSFGLVILEAWANAVPVVAYRAGGLADLVRHGQDGLLAPCGEVGVLAKALETLAQNTEMRAELGLAGQSRARNDFRWADKLEIVRQQMSELKRETRSKALA